MNRLSFSFIIILSSAVQTGCIAHLTTPSPQALGGECEPNPSGSNSAAAMIALAGLAGAGIGLAAVPDCACSSGECCSGYEGLGAGMVMIGSLVVGGSWAAGEYFVGQSNAEACRAYLVEIQRRSQPKQRDAVNDTKYHRD